MSNNNTEEKIIAHLVDKYQPVALILYGSRASGKATPQSDWDFVVLVDTSVESGSEEIEGQFIDVDTLLISTPTQEVIRIFDGTLQIAKVVYDIDGQGKALLEKVQEVYKQGRNLAEKEISNRKSFITRRLRKLEDATENHGVFFYHLGVFFEKAIQYWFELRQNRWKLSPGTALKVIAEEDKEYSQLLEILSSNVSNEKKLLAAKEIQQRVV